MLGDDGRIFYQPKQSERRPPPTPVTLVSPGASPSAGSRRSCRPTADLKYNNGNALNEFIFTPGKHPDRHDQRERRVEEDSST